MAHLTYVLVLAACLLATAPLEVWLRTGVYKRWRRLAATLTPTLVLFWAWDSYAIAAGQWRYDRHRIIGLLLPGRVPIEELLFLIVIPSCAVLTLEAVRRRRPQWRIGDERDPP